MLSEWQLVVLVAVRMLILAIFVVLYVVGGRKAKWMRRFLGGGFLAASTIGLSLITGNFEWWLLPAFLPLLIGLSFGYGGDDFWTKVRRRAVYGAMLGATGFLIGIIGHAYALGSFQFMTAVVASVLIGVTNETPAVNEEAQISLLCVCMIPFMV